VSLRVSPPCSTSLITTTLHLLRQQLHCTWEKVWDVATQKLFWFNHQTGESTWDKPRLLMRYGDVENPHPWVLLEDEQAQQEVACPSSSLSRHRAQGVEDPPQPYAPASCSYWHVPTQTSLPVGLSPPDPGT
jgi:hypothetical protein